MTFKNRRNFMRSACAALGLGLASSASARQTSGQPSKKPLSDFEITGKKTVRTTFNKNRFIIKTTYESQNLKERSGRKKFTEKKKIDRPEPKKDDLPKNGKKTTTEPWHTYLATEDQWRSISKRKRKSPNQQGVSIQHDHESEEDNYCGIGIWDYKQNTGLLGRTVTGYSVKSPMNIVCFGYDVEDVESIFADEGWHTEHDFTPSHKRYAWDKDREEFIGPDNEPKGGYSHAVNYQIGWNGRMHAKFWELEDGIVTIQAHQDGSAPDHSNGLEYNPGRNRIADILLENGGNDQGWKDLGNGKMDHSGWAKVIHGSFDSINRSC